MSETAHMPVEMEAAVLNVMRDFGSLEKTGHNAHGNYAFAKIDDYYNRIQPLLVKHGLVITSDEVESDLVPLTTGAGNTQKTTVWIKTKWKFQLCHNGVTYPQEGLHRYAFVPTAGAQTEGIAMAYASKNFMRDMFKVATGEYELDDMPPEEHGVPTVKSQEAAPGAQTPKTQLAANNNDRSVAQKLYEEITSDKVTLQNITAYRERIRNEIESPVRQEVVMQAVGAKEILLGAETKEDVERARVLVFHVKKSRLDTKSLDDLIEAKVALINAKNVKPAE